MYCQIMMYKHLTREQRYGIYLGKQKGETLEMIARSIGVHKSTVSREIKRNSTPSGKAIVLGVCNVLTMYCQSMPVLTVVCFIAGMAKIQGTFECMSNI